MDLPKHLVAVAHQRAPGFTVSLYCMDDYAPTVEQKSNPQVYVYRADKITHTYYDSGHFVIIRRQEAKIYLRFEECYNFVALDSEKDSQRPPKREEDKW